MIARKTHSGLLQSRFRAREKTASVGNLFYESRESISPATVTIDRCNRWVQSRASIVHRSKVAPARSLPAFRSGKKNATCQSNAGGQRSGFITRAVFHCAVLSASLSYDTSMNIHHLWYNNSCKACAHIPLSRYLWD